jgi:hypothetical protein
MLKVSTVPQEKVIQKFFYKIFLNDRLKVSTVPQEKFIQKF